MATITNPGAGARSSSESLCAVVWTGIATQAR
jgi:hypothetical protein